MPGFNSSTTRTNVFGQSSANPFPSTTPNYIPFTPKPFGTSAHAFSSPAFPSSSSSAAAPSIFGTSTSYPFCTCCHFHYTPCGQTCRFRNTLHGQTAALSQSSLFCSPSCGLFGGQSSVFGDFNSF
jgi:hypothetical protein